MFLDVVVVVCFGCLSLKEGGCVDMVSSFFLDKGFDLEGFVVGGCFFLERNCDSLGCFVFFVFLDSVLHSVTNCGFCSI